MKRFYSEASVRSVEGCGFEVLLDGRPVRTPGKAALVAPTRALAEAVAEEWAVQGDELEPAGMRLTAHACTAIDLVTQRRDQVVDELTGYAGTDLICYRADRPSELVARQQRAWQPLVDWAALELDAPLVVTTGILPKPQPDPAVRALRRAVEAHDDMALAALAAAVQAAGSLVIGLALSRGRLDPEGAFDAAELDASYQIELWGEDREAMRRRDGIRADLSSSRRFLELLRAAA